MKGTQEEGKAHSQGNSKYKTASTELVTDSRRRKDWKIRLEAKIKGLILQDKQDVAFFSRQRKSAGRFLSHWKVYHWKINHCMILLKNTVDRDRVENRENS